MKKVFVGLLIMMLALAVGPAAAQIGPDVPPTIISFTSDVASITLAQAEAGETTARLAWQTTNVGEEHRILISMYRLAEWVTVTDDPLPATGLLDVVLTHPLNFGPITYLLAVVDAEGVSLDQRVLVIPYADGAADAGLIGIEELNSTATSLDINQVANGTARVPVSWRVTGRQPFTNLVFEQVLPTGGVSVELPRGNLWVASSGEGVLAPVLSGETSEISLRMRVIDMREGTAIIEQMLPPIPLTGTLTPPTSTPPAVQPDVATSQVRIDYFTATPSTVNQGGTVTLSWSVAGATELAIWRLDPQKRFIESLPNPTAVGTWVVELGEYYVADAQFMLFASDALGNELQSSATVLINCTDSYFFGPAAESRCPAAPAATVQAAYQAFQGGFMLWRADTSDIFVIYNTGQIGRYRDTWVDEYFSSEEPPSGLLHPQRGFGKVWVENLPVRNGLGWATQPEVSYTMRFQRSGDLRYGRLYMTLPGGSVIYIVENTWGFEVN